MKHPGAFLQGSFRGWKSWLLIPIDWACWLCCFCCHWLFYFVICFKSSFSYTKICLDVYLNNFQWLFFNVILICFDFWIILIFFNVIFIIFRSVPRSHTRSIPPIHIHGPCLWGIWSLPLIHTQKGSSLLYVTHSFPMSGSPRND